MRNTTCSKGEDQFRFNLTDKHARTRVFNKHPGIKMLKTSRMLQTLQKKHVACEEYRLSQSESMVWIKKRTESIPFSTSLWQADRRCILYSLPHQLASLCSSSTEETAKSMKSILIRRHCLLLEASELPSSIVLIKNTKKPKLLYTAAAVLGNLLLVFWFQIEQN